MPEKETIENAARAKRAGKAPTTQAGEFVREETHHVREGKHGPRSPKNSPGTGSQLRCSCGIYRGSEEFRIFAAHFAFLRGISNSSVEVRISTQNLRMIRNIGCFNVEIPNLTELSGFLDNICERSEEFRNSTLNS